MPSGNNFDSVQEVLLVEQHQHEASLYSCAGDHGDWDLELALQHVHAAGRKVPMVVFGHMHERLKGTSVLRDMVAVDASTGTVYLNAAVVPRVRQIEVIGQPVTAPSQTKS